MPRAYSLQQLQRQTGPQNVQVHAMLLHTSGLTFLEVGL